MAPKIFHSNMPISTDDPAVCNVRSTAKRGLARIQTYGPGALERLDEQGTSWACVMRKVGM